MATVNKDFKIKSGLVVEGTTGTINGSDILTKKQADQDYIVSLIGGTATSANTPDTVVKRDGNGDFAAGTVTVNRINIGSVGYIEDDGAIVISNTDNDDIQLYADDIRLNASDDVRLTAQGGDVVISSQTGHTRFVDGPVYIGFPVEPENEVATKGYVDDSINNIDLTFNTDEISEGSTNLYYLDSRVDSHLSGGDGISYSAGTISADVANGLHISNDQIQINRNTVDGWYDASGAAATAQSNAEDYTDTAISTEVTNRNDAIATAKSEAISAAEDYTDTAVGNIVGAAPELLDTLQELAAALENNPDIIADLQDVAAGKQDTLTAGANINIDGSSVISVTGLDTADVAEDASFLYFTNQRALDATSAAYDIAGAAQTAYNNAVSDAAFDATSKANTAQDNANDYTDQEISSEVTNRNNAITSAIDALNTDAIEEGATNLYFTDSRAKASAGDLLAGAEKENIQITYTGGVLSITAENGVADSTTDDLAEGATNKYFSDSLALGAIEDANIQPSSIDITWVRREEATWTDVNTASKATCHSAGSSVGSMKYLVRVVALVGGTRHSHVTEVLATVDNSNGVAVVEYGTIYTSAEPLATVTVEWNAGTSAYDLNVTTANNNSEVMVAATLITALD
jgi:hypothetical protein